MPCEMAREGLGLWPRQGAVTSWTRLPSQVRPSPDRNAWAPDLAHDFPYKQRNKSRLPEPFSFFTATSVSRSTRQQPWRPTCENAAESDPT